MFYAFAAYYRGAMGILLVYDVTDEASFNSTLLSLVMLAFKYIFNGILLIFLCICALMFASISCIFHFSCGWPIKLYFPFCYLSFAFFLFPLIVFLSDLRWIMSTKGYVLLLSLLPAFQFLMYRASFWQDIRNWIRNIEQHASDNVNKILVGNKADMDESKRVCTSEGPFQYTSYILVGWRSNLIE